MPIHEVFPLLCPKCGGKMRVIDFITEPSFIRDILDHLGVPASPQRLLPARGPPLWGRDDETSQAARRGSSCPGVDWAEN